MHADDKTRLRGLEEAEVRQIQATIPYLSYRDGELSVDGIPVGSIWDGGHPLVIFLPRRAVDNYRTLIGAFREYFPTRVCHALKSCYLPAVSRALMRAGADVEVMTEFEWLMAMRIGFSPGRVVANGTARAAHHRDDLIRARPFVIGIDGHDELDRVIEASSRMEARPKIAIRVNPFDADDFFHGGSKLGVGVQESYEILETALKSQHVDVVGLHAHQLRQCVDPDRYHLLARRLCELAIEVSGRSRRISLINLGGGLEARFLMERSGVTCGDFAAAAKDGLSAYDSKFELILEPGRYLVADAAIALTRVLGIKRSAATGWIVTEIGTNALPPFPDRAYHPLPIVIDDDGGQWNSYNVTDTICIPSTLCSDAVLPRHVEDSAIALLNSGAYTTSYAEAWGCDLPDIAVLSDSTVRQVFGRADQEKIITGLYGELA